MILFYFGLALAAIGTWADHVTTTTALRIPGVREVNPIARWVIERTGKVWAATLVLNIVLMVGVSLLLWPIAPDVAGLWLTLAGVAKMAAAAGNQKLIKRKT